MKLITNPNYYIEHRPWGHFRCFGQNVQSTAKVLVVDPGQALSTQYHDNRDQHYYVMGESVVCWSTHPVPHEMDVDEVRRWWADHYGSCVAKAGDEFWFQRRHIHGIHNAGPKPLIVFEVAYGENDEEDIVRVQDRYGRANGLW